MTQEQVWKTADLEGPLPREMFVLWSEWLILRDVCHGVVRKDGQPMLFQFATFDALPECCFDDSRIAAEACAAQCQEYLTGSIAKLEKMLERCRLRLQGEPEIVSHGAEYAAWRQRQQRFARPDFFPPS